MTELSKVTGPEKGEFEPAVVPMSPVIPARKFRHGTYGSSYLNTSTFCFVRTSQQDELIDLDQARHCSCNLAF